MESEEISNGAVIPDIELVRGNSRVSLSLQGAHITSYTVAGEEVLWMSRTARFAQGVAIRGGIPLCWPWFSASPDNDTWPQHGFARTTPFHVVSRTETADFSSVILALSSESPIPEWQGKASLEVEIRLSDRLWMELRTTNVSDSAIQLGAALHSYFLVSRISRVSIPSVTGLDYLDKTLGYATGPQTEALKIDREIDRVYLNPPRSAELLDQDGRSKTVIESWGNTDLVIWNPGAKVAAGMADFDDEGYQRMVCIEPAIALTNRVLVQPGETHAIGQTIQHVPDSP